MLAVQGQRGERINRAEVMREGERQAEQAGHLRAVATGAEQPDGGLVAQAGHRGDPRELVPVRPVAGEEAEQVHELLGEIVRGQRLRRAAQRRRRDLVRTRRAADAEVDAAGMERLEHAELLGDHQRHMVGQHHAAGADPDDLRRVGDVTDQHGRRRAGDAGHVVVLGHPEPVETEVLGALGQVDGGPECVACVPAVRYGGQVKHRKRYGPRAEGQACIYIVHGLSEQRETPGSSAPAD